MRPGQRQLQEPNLDPDRGQQPPLPGDRVGIDPTPIQAPACCSLQCGLNIRARAAAQENGPSALGGIPAEGCR